MSYSVLIHDLALDELNEAMDYYDAFVPVLGIKLLNEFNEVVGSVVKGPEIYQKQFKQFRQARLKKFPYCIVYRIEGGVIVVYRFFHAKRNPNKKYKN